MERTPDIVKGTLDLLVLKALSWGPAHGYAVARWIEGATDDLLAVGEGTLYPALHRLEERGLVAAKWGASENNRRAKYYELTRQGRLRLQVEVASWERLRGGHLRGARRACAPLGQADAPLDSLPRSVRSKPSCRRRRGTRLPRRDADA